MIGPTFEDRNPSGDESFDQELSKTKKKQHAADLQRLGLELSRLPPKQLDTLNLEPKLREAVDEAQRIKPGGAFNRQVKYIGGLLREMDADTISAKLSALLFQGSASARHHHLIEKWRDRLLDEGDHAIEALLEQFPAIDRQQIRQLLRNVQKEAELGRPPRSARLLFRYLRENISSERV